MRHSEICQLRKQLNKASDIEQKKQSTPLLVLTGHVKKSMLGAYAVILDLRSVNRSINLEYKTLSLNDFYVPGQWTLFPKWYPAKIQD